jgi:hypothetical protein
MRAGVIVRVSQVVPALAAGATLISTISATSISPIRLAAARALRRSSSGS